MLVLYAFIICMLCMCVCNVHSSEFLYLSIIDPAKITEQWYFLEKLIVCHQLLIIMYVGTYTVSKAVNSIECLNLLCSSIKGPFLGIGADAWVWFCGC